MLVELEAFLGLVPGDQLDLGIGKSFGRQEGQHLMTGQMRMHGLRDAGLLAVALHDLLDAAGCERSSSLMAKPSPRTRHGVRACRE